MIIFSRVWEEVGWWWGRSGSVEEKENSMEETGDFKSKCVWMLLSSASATDISVPTCARFSLLNLCFFFFTCSGIKSPFNL